MAIRQRGYRASYDQNNPYYPAHEQQRSKPWYKNIWIILGIAFLVILFLIAASGNLKMPSKEGNETELREPTMKEQLVNFIVEQRKAEVSDNDIKNKLVISGYSEKEIENAFQLADPTAQYILNETKKGTPKYQIVEELMKQGVDPVVINEKFKIIEEEEKGIAIMPILILVIIGVLIYNFFIKKQVSEEKKAPKVYTLDECREHAEEILEEKYIDFVPCHEYLNRPELRQYRFVFKEPLYPGFNMKSKYGDRAGPRKLYLIAIGYDNEMVTFKSTFNDTEANEFLDGAPAQFEQRGIMDYSRLRERSERTIPERPEEEIESRYGRPPLPTGSPSSRTTTTRRRPYSRVRSMMPGPIEGYEGEF